VSETGTPTDEEPRRLREAVLRTQGEGTAVLRYEHFAQLALHKTLASKYPAVAGLFDYVDQAIGRRQVESAPHREQQPGQIDFRNRRSMFSLGSSGEHWLLYVDGVAFGGKPGAWFARAAGPAGLLNIDGPFWILALVSAAVEVREHGVATSETRAAGAIAVCRTLPRPRSLWSTRSGRCGSTIAQTRIVCRSRCGSTTRAESAARHWLTRPARL